MPLTIAPEGAPHITIDTTRDNVVGDVPEVVPEEVPPKKKKKPRLTKAEKKARKLKAALEFKKAEMRAHLKRELELSRKSAKRGREEWEDLCKEIKIMELREEVIEWEKKAQRMLEMKDEKIVRLLDDMATTEEMHKRNFSRQLELLDYITNCYKTIVDCSKSLYETQAFEIIKDFHEELNAKKEIEDFNKTNCENIMHATGLVLEHQLQDDYKIYLEKQNDSVNTEIERRYIIRDGIIDKMSTLRRQLMQFVQSLQSANLDVHHYERIHLLMERQRNFILESQKLNDTEFRQTRLYSDLHRELLHIEVEAQRKINDLRLEHSYFMKVRKNIENNISIDREITFEKLKILGSQSFETIKKLKRLEKYGELLLCLAANCRKLQTESEKVVPWGEFPEPKERDSKDEEKELDENEWKLQVLNLKAHVDLTEEELGTQLKLMKRFWRRQALVEMQNLLLNEEKQKLTAENQKYINFIKSLSKTDNVEELSEAMTITRLVPFEFPCQELSQKRKKKK